MNLLYNKDMHKKFWWIIGILLALIVGAGAYAYFNKDAAAPDNSSQSMKQGEVQEQSSAKVDPGTVPAGKYEEYSAKAIAAAKGDRILFFHASWCPQCRELEKSIKAAVLPTNLTIFKVDYDSHQDLRQKYGVTLQTTLVKIDENGNKIKSYVAYGEPTFSAVKRELL